MWLGLYWSDGIPIKPLEYYLDYVIFNVLRGFSTWLWVIAILSLGRRYLNFTNPLLQYASEASYPFYILHQTIMVGVAFFVVRWSIGIMGKYYTICLVSLVGTITLYELFIKRINLMRFLFGMKPKKITTV
jgi:peptidoglycan/LPS O-acetylase OafA/YrhL